MQQLSGMQKLVFILIHMLQFELLLVLLGTSLMSWWLSGHLKNQSAKAREAKIALRCSQALLLLALALWLTSRILR